MIGIKVAVHCSKCHVVDNYMDSWDGPELKRVCLNCGHSKVMAVITTSDGTELNDPGNPKGDMVFVAQANPKVEIF